jgi:hypothetical protein
MAMTVSLSLMKKASYKFYYGSYHVHAKKGKKRRRRKRERRKIWHTILTPPSDHTAKDIAPNDGSSCKDNAYARQKVNHCKMRVAAVVHFFGTKIVLFLCV